MVMNDEQNFVPRTECQIRCQKLEDEDRRQNERIRKLEDSVGEIDRIARSTERLAVSMEQMLEEQTKQGERISKIEERDGEKWRGTVKTIITVTVTVIVTAIVTAALSFIPK
ncbi:MAG: hypothetical protein OSJ43_06490 [Oscillospiraceae bacterium]|nr:hypothetical protein [Oscillospiraceae bacterium]